MIVYFHSRIFVDRDVSGLAATGSGTTTRKVEPSPKRLFNDISPPGRRTNSRVTARPRPELD